MAGVILSDDDGHKYFVPVEQEDAFLDALKHGERDEYVEFEKRFGSMRMGCHLSAYHFEMVKNADA